MWERVGETSFSVISWYEVFAVINVHQPTVKFLIFLMSQSPALYWNLSLWRRMSLPQSVKFLMCLGLLSTAVCGYFLAMIHITWHCFWWACIIVSCSVRVCAGYDKCHPHFKGLMHITPHSCGLYQTLVVKMNLTSRSVMFMVHAWTLSTALKSNLLASIHTTLTVKVTSFPHLMRFFDGGGEYQPLYCNVLMQLNHILLLCESICCWWYTSPSL